MSKNKKNDRDRWSFSESVLTFIPGSKVYGTMRSRQARQGVMFILPFIIGFLVFMLKPMVESVIFSFSSVKLIPGQGYELSLIHI